METFYHGTSKDRARSIEERGLLGAHAGTGVASVESNLAKQIGEDNVKGKVYLTRNINNAAGYGFQEAAKDFIKFPGQSRADHLILDDPEIKQNARILKAKIPYQDLQDGTIKRVANPELRGLTEEEFINNAIKSNPQEIKGLPEEEARKRLSRFFRSIDYPNTLVVQGDISPRHFTTSNHYQGQTLEGLTNYIKNNPKRFSGGLTTAGLGVGLMGAGLSLLRKKENE